jgi:hypothetical protein
MYFSVHEDFYLIFWCGAVVVQPVYYPGVYLEVLWKATEILNYDSRYPG